MKVALFGASGNVGSRIFTKLLNRGHEVTGIARQPEKLQRHDRLVAKQGDINDEPDLPRFSLGTIRSSALSNSSRRTRRV